MKFGGKSYCEVREREEHGSKARNHHKHCTNTPFVNESRAHGVQTYFTDL